MMDETTLTALLAEGSAAYAQGDFAGAARGFQAAAAAARQLGNQVSTANALVNLAAAHGEMGALEEAQAELGEAIHLHSASANLLGQCQAQISLATVLGRLGRAEESRQTWQSTLELARHMLNGELAAIATAGLAGMHAKLGQPAEALALQQKLLAYYEKKQDLHEQIDTLIDMARIELEQGDTRSVEQHGQRALFLARKVQDDQYEAYCLYKLGSLYRTTGFNLEGRDLLIRSVSAYRTLGKIEPLGMAVNELAMVYDHLGQYQQALTLYEEAMGIAESVGNQSDQGAALHGIGYVYHQVGRLEEARTYYHRALALTEAVGDWRSAALTLTNLGVVCADLGREDEALPLLHQALFHQKKGGDRLSQGHTLISIAALQERQGDPDGALATLQEALSLQKQTSDRNSQAATHNAIGDVHLAREEYELALAEKRQALELFRQVSNPVGQIQAYYTMARLHARTGELDAAVLVLDEAVRLIEGMRLNLVSESLRTAYFAHMQNIYALYVEVLLAMQRAGQAFEMVERSKARAFLDLLAEAQSAFRADLDPALRGEELRLLEEMDALTRQSAALSSGGESNSEALLAKRQELERRYQVLQGTIRSQNPRYSALTQPVIWGISQVQSALLDEHTALLEYILGENVSTLFVVLHDSFEVFRLPPRAQIETRVRELRASLTLHRYLHGDALYQDLIQPAEELIRGKDLLIVADGVLHYLPFALLLTRPPEEGTDAGMPDPGTLRSAQAFSEDTRISERLAAQVESLPPFDFPRLPYLIREHAVWSIPSASAACFMAGELAGRGKGRRPGMQIAALGDPLVQGTGDLPAGAQRSLGAGLDPLPATRAEVWKLAGLFEHDLPPGQPQEYRSGRVSLFTGDKASKAQVLALTDGSQEYRFLHLATHGLLNIEDPQFSGLLFSAPQGGSAYWQTFEIFQAHIPAETVVLSACETGLGKVIRGEGLVGLARAFLYAGAARVCVSLWKVADDSTPGLMEGFYAAMLAGSAPAQALRRAQIALMEEGTWSHPYFWAPFVILGSA